MAGNTYLILTPTIGTPLKSDNAIDLDGPSYWAGGPAGGPFDYRAAPLSDTVFEVSDVSTDIEQTLSIGSQSTGAGAGKVTFNPFSIRRQVDSVTSQLVVLASSGKAFKYVDLVLTKAGAELARPAPYLIYRYGLCAIKTVGWAADEGSLVETVTFEYGALAITYRKQNRDGTFGPWSKGAGWNRVKNVLWDGTAPIST